MFSQIFLIFLIFEIFLENILAFHNYEKWTFVNLRPARKGSNSFPEILNHLEGFEHSKIIQVTKDEIQVGFGPQFSFPKLENMKKIFDLKSAILHHDISKLIEKTDEKVKRSLSQDQFSRYMDYEQMEQFFSVLETSYPEIVQRKIVGKSFEGRNISLFVITSKRNQSNCQRHGELQDTTNQLINKRNIDFKSRRIIQSNQQTEEFQRFEQKIGQPIISNPQNGLTGNGTHYFIYLNAKLLKEALNRSFSKFKMREKLTSEKPVIFIDAGLHSREWICPAVALFIIQHLAENPSLTSEIEWYIMPLVNPDGYKFSWNGDRFWRKTRSKSRTSECYGADINRNFNFHWSEIDTSKNPCAENYGGEGPDSEIETVIIRDVLTKVKHRLKAYISLHSWGQQILYPYSYNAQKLPRSEQEMIRVGQGMVHAIKKSQNTDYHTGRGSVLLYPASGTSIDWVYDVLQVPYSYLIELRDSLGLLGFILPESMIRPTGEDMFAAMKVLAKEILETTNNTCP